MPSRRSNDDTRAPWAILDADLWALAPTLGALPEPRAVEVAFAGRSNVGKSSAMNALMGRRRLVRTSGTPGCTRALGLFWARARDGQELVLVDLPGYGYAQRSRSERSGWASLIEQYLEGRDALRAVVVLIDARHGLTEADQALIEMLAAVRVSRSGREPRQDGGAGDGGGPTQGDDVAPGPEGPREPAGWTFPVAPLGIVVAATKLDKVPASRRKAVLAAIARSSGHRVVGLSSTTGEGIGALWQAIRQLALPSGP